MLSFRSRPRKSRKYVSSPLVSLNFKKFQMTSLQRSILSVRSIYKSKHSPVPFHLLFNPLLLRWYCRLHFSTQHMKFSSTYHFLLSHGKPCYGKNKPNTIPFQSIPAGHKKIANTVLRNVFWLSLGQNWKHWFVHHLTCKASYIYHCYFPQKARSTSLHPSSSPQVHCSSPSSMVPRCVDV